MVRPTTCTKILGVIKIIISSTLLIGIDIFLNAKPHFIIILLAARVGYSNRSVDAS